MDQFFIYQILNKCPYPFIVRHNRSELYQKYPEVDPVMMVRKSVFLATAGYFVGTFVRRPLTVAILTPLPLFIKFLYDEYQIKLKG
jgi:hypothetical protein